MRGSAAGSAVRRSLLCDGLRCRVAGPAVRRAMLCGRLCCAAGFAVWWGALRFVLSLLVAGTAATRS